MEFFTIDHIKLLACFLVVYGFGWHNGRKFQARQDELIGGKVWRW